MITISSDQAVAQAAESRRVRLERLLQIAARDFDLRLEFGDRDLLGDGQIVMRATAEGVAQASYRALKGQAVHLLGHYLSDSLTWADAARRQEAEDKPYFAALWHALEDARVENWLVQRCPGTHKAFEANLLPNLGGSLLSRMSVTHQIEMGLYLEGRRYRGVQFGPRVRAVLDAVGGEVREGASGHTPRASLDAMQAIYPAVAGLLEPARPLHSAPRPLQSERRRAELRMAQSGDEEARSRKGPAHKAPGIETSDEVVSIGVMGHRREFPEWFRPGTAPWFERGLGQKNIYPTAMRTDRQTMIRPSPGNYERYRTLRSEVQHEVGFLISRLTNLIRDETDLRYGGHFRTGRLNMARLWKQRTGHFRLFQRPVSGGRRGVAFTLRVDERASMKGLDKWRVATKAALLLGETLDRLDVPLEIIGYTTSEFEAQAAMRLGLTPAHEYRTTRCSPLEHRIYKHFNEPYRLVHTRVTDIQPRHNNWDEEHLLFAFRRIQVWSEINKVIIVISDGQPNGDANHLIATVAALEQLGCKIVGVGIGAEFVREIYPNAIVVSNFQQMAEELLYVLGRELRRGIRYTAPTVAEFAA